MVAKVGPIKAFSLDLGRCTGCEACRLACTIENGLEWGSSWRQVVTFNPCHHPGAGLFHLSLACNHCADAPCMTGCPALAYARDGASGAVLLDESRCIGCQYCSWVCPFDAPRFDSAKGVMSKCTFCSHRLAAGEDPACVAACPTGALGCDDLDGLGGVEHVPGFPRAEIGPSIRFTQLDPTRSPVSSEIARKAVAASIALQEDRGASPSSIGPRTEWPLLVLTLLAAALVASFSAGLAGALALDPALFAAASGGGAAVSTLHLGRKERAWRALLNVKRSWLSREVAAFTAFVVLGLASLLAPELPVLGGVAVVGGFVTLFCMDRVYPVGLRPTSSSVHSADVLLTGSFLTALLLDEPLLVLPLGLLKLLLYLKRKQQLAGPRGGDHLRSFARVGVGLLLPAILWPLGLEGLETIALTGIALGELVDRWEFYSELEIPSPRRQVEVDLRSILTSNGGPSPRIPGGNERS